MKISRNSLVVLALVASGLAVRAEQWPQFRGPGSTGVAEGANLPDTWSTTQNVKWKTTIPGQGWSSPIAWGDRIFVTSVVPGRRDRDAQARPVSPGRAPRADDRASLHGLRDLVRDRQDHLAAAVASRRSSRSAAPEEHVRVGDAGHRRQARLRGVRQRRHLRHGLRRRAGVVETNGRRRHAQWLGHGIIAGASRRTPVFRQRQRGRVVADGRRGGDREDDLAHRATEGNELGNAVRVASCGAHGDRHQRHERDSFVRSRRRRAVAARSVFDARDPDAVCRRRSVVRVVRLRR